MLRDLRPSAPYAGDLTRRPSGRSSPRRKPGSSNPVKRLDSSACPGPRSGVRRNDGQGALPRAKGLSHNPWGSGGRGVFPNAPSPVNPIRLKAHCYDSITVEQPARRRVARARSARRQGNPGPGREKYLVCRRDRPSDSADFTCNSLKAGLVLARQRHISKICCRKG